MLADMSKLRSPAKSRAPHAQAPGLVERMPERAEVVGFYLSIPIVFYVRRPQVTSKQWLVWKVP
jgi:hypothetical protein